MEFWKDIPGYEGLYEVNNEGKVKRLERVIIRSNGRLQVIEEKILTPKVDKDGYLFVGLRKDGVRRHLKVHRLVALTFIPNPESLPQVNHKDEDKANNKVENLEWCTAEYNINYGTRNLRMANVESKQVFQYSLDDELINVWDSVSECDRNGYTSSAISSCCNNKYLSQNNNIYKGCKWSYQPL